LFDYDKGVAMMGSFKEIERQQNNFSPTNTTSRKELGYYGVKVIKPLKVFAPQYVERLSSRGGSRDSLYYQVPYLDPITQQIESFLVDEGWRKKEFRRIVDRVNLSPSFLVRVGERRNFLVGVG